MRPAPRPRSTPTPSLSFARRSPRLIGSRAQVRAVVRADRVGCASRVLRGRDLRGRAWCVRRAGSRRRPEALRAVRRQPGARGSRWRWRRPATRRAIARLLRARTSRGWSCRTRTRRARSPRRRVKTDTARRADAGAAAGRRASCRRCGSPMSTRRRAAAPARAARAAGAPAHAREERGARDPACATWWRAARRRDLFGVKGRAWLAEQELPADERRDRRRRCCASSTSSATSSRLIDAELARHALGCAGRSSG